MAGLEIKIKPRNGSMSGQESEKAEIAQIKEWADNISSACDSLLQREEQEDSEMESDNDDMNKEGVLPGNTLSDKVAFIKSQK